MGDQKRRNRGGRSRRQRALSSSPGDPAVVALEALRRLARDLATDQGVDPGEALPVASMSLKLELPLSRFNDAILQASAATVRETIDRQIDDGLRANHAAPAGNECRHAGDAILMRFGPIRIDRILEAAGFQHSARIRDRQPDGFNDRQKFIGIADIAPVDEIAPVKRIVQRLAAIHGIGPFAEFLR